MRRERDRWKGERENTGERSNVSYAWWGIAEPALLGECEQSCAGSEQRGPTGKERRAEGESLNVLGWVSPIACGLGGGAAQGKPFQLSVFYPSPHLPMITKFPPPSSQVSSTFPKEEKKTANSATQSSSLSSFNLSLSFYYVRAPSVNRVREQSTIPAELRRSR